MRILRTLLALLLMVVASACRDGEGRWPPRRLHSLPAAGPIALAHPEPRPAPSSVSLETVTDGLIRPVTLAHNGDQIFVALKEGQVRIVGDSALYETPFLDIGDRVATDGSERGLLGLAFHPHYPDDPRFFVLFTNLDGDTELRSFEVNERNPFEADPDSSQLLLLIEQPYGNHNGGQLLFGPDGYLYVGLGDGGAVSDPYGNAQDPGTLLGAILRLDVDSDPYAIPPDNPFVGDSDKRGEVWHYGLRNPWSFRFDPVTGDLYIADVGQEGPEEVNYYPAEGAAGGRAGVNFGWPVREGYDCYDDPLDDDAPDGCPLRGFQMPVYTYAHTEGNCAIVGGAVYHGERLPDLQGQYLFADYCSGRLWSLRYADGLWKTTLLHKGGAPISYLGAGPDGELYALHFERNGELVRLVPGEETGASE